MPTLIDIKTDKTITFITKLTIARITSICISTITKWMAKMIIIGAFIDISANIYVSSEIARVAFTFKTAFCISTC